MLGGLLRSEEAFLLPYLRGFDAVDARGGPDLPRRPHVPMLERGRHERSQRYGSGSGHARFPGPWGGAAGRVVLLKKLRRAKVLEEVWPVEAERHRVHSLYKQRRPGTQWMLVGSSK